MTVKLRAKKSWWLRISLASIIIIFSGVIKADIQYATGAQLGFSSISPTTYDNFHYQRYIGISDNNIIIGENSSYTTDGGFVYDEKTGIKTSLSYPSDSNMIVYKTTINAISSNGIIAGLYYWCNRSEFPQCSNLNPKKSLFLYINGAYKTYVQSPLIRDANFHSGINNNGDFVASYCDQEYPGETSCHGSLYHNGRWIMIDYPGAMDTYATDINNNGDIVGYYYYASNDYQSSGGAFIYKDNKITSLCEFDIHHTNATNFYCPLPLSINDNGEMVASFNSWRMNWAVFSNGVWNISKYRPNDYRPSLWDINNNGQITGQYTFQYGSSSNIIATLNTPTLIDPVPSLLDGPQITSKLTAANASPDQPYLADLTKGRPVNGLATDGVTQVILRIPANAVGDQFTLNIRPDQCSGINFTASDCIDEYGLIFDPANPPANVFSNQQSQQTPIVVTAVSTDKGPIAFAAYRAPVDFVRSRWWNAADETQAQRSVFLSVSSIAFSQSITQPDFEIKLVRPPVVLVHGLWATKNDLFDLSTGFQNDPHFSVTSVDYGEPIEIKYGIPPVNDYFVIPVEWALSFLSEQPLGSALGFQYGADAILPQLDKLLDKFKTITNPVSQPLAAVGLDFVAHSMGNLVTRTLTLQGASYYSTNTYQRGYIHKLISVVGPHLGSPFAMDILKPENECIRSLVNTFANPSFSEECGNSPCVDALTTQPVTQSEYLGPGAVGSLKGSTDSSETGLSFALNNLFHHKPSVPLPTAYLTGRMSDEQIARVIKPIPYYKNCSTRHPQDCTNQPFPINRVQMLAAICKDDPMGKKFLDPSTFRAFMTSDSDGIVPLKSQLNGLPDDYFNNVPELAPLEGVLHSPGTGGLYNLNDGSSAEPTALNNQVADRVKALLNIPVTRTDVFVR